jgi:two-component system, OmpR family, phosphate regulon sensor histidine kinase PhoR
MKRSKNSLTLILMVSSILLMLLLQVFWLRTTYRDAEDQFRKETNFLFRNTIFSMHDSLIQRSIVPITSLDSGENGFPMKRFRNNDSTVVNELIFQNDNRVGKINVREKTSRIEIFSTTERVDSVQKILRPLVTKFQMDRGSKRFIVRMFADSLHVDSINLFYKNALKEVGIHSPFKVISLKGRLDRNHIAPQHNGNITSEPVPITPLVHYAVMFEDADGILLKKITPEIIFSFVLTSLTVLAFVVMYRNLRSQQRLMEIKNDFISNITHELKTPVATVSVALEALKNFNALEDRQRTSEYLEIAQNELSRLTLMTDKILKTAIFEEHGVDLKVEKFDIDALFRQVLVSMKLVFEKRNTKLNYTAEGDTFFVHGSKEHLTNVLYNLLDNALKYSGENAIVSVALNVNTQQVVFSVQDDGVGIQQEYQKKIFEKFFRVPSGDIHTIKGHGLGLSYVYSVISSHGGTIRVESEINKGSLFEITLPQASRL